MRGSSGRRLACRSGDWPGPRWLGRRCQYARLRLERALRADGVRLRLGLGTGALVMASAAAGATPPAPDADGNAESRPPKPRSYSDLGHPARRATDVFLILNGVVWLLNWLAKDALIIWGCKVNSLIASGQVWRLLTAGFLHANPVHLLINMHALHTLGPQVEVVSGSKRTAVIYLLAGICSSLASFLFCPQPSLGASGAVFGLGAALAVFYWQHREVLGPTSNAGLRSLGLAAAVNVGYSLINKKIDNYGHAGGLLAGAVLAYLLGPRFVAVLREDGGRGLQDLPPVRWLAFKSPEVGGSAGGPSLPLLRRRFSPSTDDDPLSAARRRRRGPPMAGEGQPAAAQRPSGDEDDAAPASSTAATG